MISNILFGFSILSIVYFVLQYLQRQARIVEFKSKYSCSEPTRYPDKDLWGSDLLKESKS